jgi:hypothetical protein
MSTMTVPLDANKSTKIARILEQLQRRTGITWEARLDANHRVNIRFLGKNIWIVLDDEDSAETKAEKVVKAMYAVATRISQEEFDFLTQLRQATTKPATAEP